MGIYGVRPSKAILPFFPTARRSIVCLVFLSFLKLPCHCVEKIGFREGLECKGGGRSKGFCCSALFYRPVWGLF
jgi:hypothetical protein